MKALQTLIKLSRTKVEDKQKEIAVFREKIANIEGRIVELEQAIVDEEAASKGSLELQGYFGPFHQRALKQIEGYQKDIARLEQELAPHLDELAELFAEQKRVEILYERRKEEARKLMLKKEQQELDEIATQRHIRKTR
ncbi:MAG: flagellar export protein FliJ [Proteobacteria bacterium]|nr:flagellar export protein FliJ [Pseudomonadota bacterium]